MPSWFHLFVAILVAVAGAGAIILVSGGTELKVTYDQAGSLSTDGLKAVGLGIALVAAGSGGYFLLNRFWRW